MIVSERSPPSSSIARAASIGRAAPCRANPPGSPPRRRRGPSRSSPRSSSAGRPRPPTGRRRRSPARRGRRSPGACHPYASARATKTLRVPAVHRRAPLAEPVQVEHAREVRHAVVGRGLHRLPDRSLGGLGVPEQDPDASGAPVAGASRAPSRARSPVPGRGSRWRPRPTAARGPVPGAPGSATRTAGARGGARRRSPRSLSARRRAAARRDPSRARSGRSPGCAGSARSVRR